MLLICNPQGVVIDVRLRYIRILVDQCSFGLFSKKEEKVEEKEESDDVLPGIGENISSRSCAEVMLKLAIAFMLSDLNSNFIITWMLLSK
ncbi:hypothetical protein Hdeb2414_s0006g00199881 [Helianthus debilis subsp. tardiflorus]